MQGIKSLQLHNVRSHKSARFQFASDMNAIVGPNGSGKTTIIVGLYTLLRGNSFKGTIGEMTRYGTNQFQVSTEVNTTHTTHKRALYFQQINLDSQRTWMIDEKKYSRLPISIRLPVVLFEPDLARLVTGSPERRRQYLDQIAGQMNYEVTLTQNRFERTLKQRNQLLKRLGDQTHVPPPDELFIWNTQLAQLSEKIVLARHNVISQIQSDISKHYRQLGGTDDIFLTYLSNVSLDQASYGTKLLHFLETSYRRDVGLGYTSFGPHRDDLEIRLADQPATQRASRGEIRTIVIALKLLETEILSQHYAINGIKPTLLLDDVLSELDLVHQERVLSGLSNHQVFITTTDAHALTPGVHTIALE